MRVKIMIGFPKINKEKHPTFIFIRHVACCNGREEEKGEWEGEEEVGEEEEMEILGKPIKNGKVLNM